MQKDFVTVTIKLERKAFNLISQKAKEHGRTKSDLIRFYLEILLGIRKKPKSLI